MNLNTAVYLLESLQVYVRGLSERYGTFEDQAKEKSGNQTYTKTKDSSRNKQCKYFQDESGEEHDALMSFDWENPIGSITSYQSLNR